jgi:hypothetical protein
MKKAYVKPTISFESFKMSSSIAGTCVLQANSGDPNSCEYTTSMGFVIFTAACTGKDEYSSQDGTEYGVCYDVPTADVKVFAS